MSSTPSFPFGQLPGGSAANPLLQGLEMMRQSWGQFAPGQLGASFNPPTMLDPSDLDRRINELQAIENWLTLNLTMLQGSIRAMEVQRATLATLHSFASMGNADLGAVTGTPNLAWPAAASSPSSGSEAAPARPQAPAGSGSPGAETSDSAKSANDAAASPPDFTAFANPAQAAEAQQAWWNLLQQQFNQIASAAAASFPATTADHSTPAATQEPTPTSRKTATRSATPRKAASKTATSKSSTRRSS